MGACASTAAEPQPFPAVEPATKEAASPSGAPAAAAASSAALTASTPDPAREQPSPPPGKKLSVVLVEPPAASASGTVGIEGSPSPVEAAVKTIIEDAATSPWEVAAPQQVDLDEIGEEVASVTPPPPRPQSPTFAGSSPAWWTWMSPSSIFKGSSSRRASSPAVVASSSNDDQALSTAAIRLQAVQRGRMARAATAPLPLPVAGSATPARATPPLSHSRSVKIKKRPPLTPSRYRTPKHDSAAENALGVTFSFTKQQHEALMMSSRRSACSDPEADTESTCTHSDTTSTSALADSGMALADSTTDLASLVEVAES